MAWAPRTEKLRLEVDDVLRRQGSILEEMSKSAESFPRCGASTTGVLVWFLVVLRVDTCKCDYMVNVA